MSRKYAIIDIETTGGIPKRDKITEIAIITHNGQKILEEYQSLVNPERSIPPQITRITGITNDMVADAPKFYELAKTIIEMTEGAIFVAHNVRFDYQFIKEEFKSLGYTYTKRNLCSVRLARKAFPHLKSYSLGNLIKYFGIEVENRHRAYDDALATTILFQMILDQHNTKKEANLFVTSTLKQTQLPKGLPINTVDNLPEACGVYYFTNDDGKIIYVGKSINIKKRAKQHFSKQTKKANKLFQSVVDISYEITGSELASLLKESYEIKQIQPEINIIQKSRHFAYAIIEAENPDGYKYFEIVKSNKTELALSYYNSRKSALRHIEQMGEIFLLCQKVNKVDKSKSSCFNYGINKCNGACIQEESVDEYNERFEESLVIVNKIFDQNFILIDVGRTDNEKCIFLVEDGHYRGYGYTDMEYVAYGIEELKECIKYEKINPEADLIVRNHVWSNPELDIHYF